MNTIHKLHDDLSFNMLVFDLETTGLSVENDRIIEMAIKHYDGCSLQNEYRYLFNPQIPITNADVHNIYDVNEYPLIADKLDEIKALFESVEMIVGYNILNYDLPLLLNEFDRNDNFLDLRKSIIVDVYDMTKNEIGNLVRLYYAIKYKDTDKQNLKLQNVVDYYSSKFGSLFSFNTQYHNATNDVNATIYLLSCLIMDNIALQPYHKNFKHLGNYVIKKEDVNEIIINNGSYKGLKLNEVIKMSKKDDKTKKWLLTQSNLVFSKEILNELK